ncbi:LysR family transcriptional regulator [Pseudorhodoferax sp. Leaf274]|uniref:LysR family transcriptional regulator n=1 Tax=Pseudorhodoferax sp. Leaf274 TaxID=1736318 RepID=UPI0007037E32|nr:LysR family transcriptional regulator [Pseudorhodoferax sp. Leaf274]KQP49255.1 LysR family transcriptional regulator [Pseudorhodoferax sp. Leaf274]
MELRTLRYFIAVLEAGSLSRAAGSLYVAQPALTAQIRKLEEELGAQLFERSHAGMAPTPAGLQLYQDARRLLSDAAAVRERVRSLPQGPEGSVTVALPFLIASLLMGPVLAGLKATHPRIRVFVLDDLSLMVRKAMLDRRADIGILVDQAQVDGLRCRPFAREAMYFCGRDLQGTVAPLLQPAPAGEGHPRIAFAAAAAQPLVLQSRRFSIRQRVEDAANAQEVPLNIVHEHDSARVIRSLYACGAGFTFTPACALPDAGRQAAPWLVARVVQPELQRSYSLATAADRPLDAAARVVVQAIEAHARTLIAGGRWEAEWLGEADAVPAGHGPKPGRAAR